MLEILHGPFVLLGFLSSGKRAEISPFPRFRIELPRIETIQTAQAGMSCGILTGVRSRRYDDASAHRDIG